MFGWSQPRCPLDPDDQHWIERRMTWLSDEFGIDRLLDARLVLPTDEFFPEPYAATAEGVRRLLERVCGYMGADARRVGLDFYSQHESVSFNVGMVDSRTGAAGIYDESSGQITVWLEASTLSDPANVVATLAHEVGHVHLLGDRRLTGDEPDHEPLTDLLTVYLGLGVFTANSVIREVIWRDGNWEGWSVGRQGYLTAPLFAYALALFAWYRGETAKEWSSHLRLDVRSPLQRCLRFLDKARAPTLPQRRDGPALPPGAFPPERAESHAEDEVGEFDPDSVDACIARGVVHANNGQWDEALREYTEAIHLDPDDGETYLLRGQVFVGMGRFREALADAERAVELDPEELETYRLRGMVRLHTSDAHRAIDDFDVILAEEPQDAAAWLWRGRCHAALRQHQEAVADYSRAIRLAPHLADAYLARGEAYEKLGRFDEARADREEGQHRTSRLTAE